MENRVNVLETAIQDLTGKLDVFATRIEECFVKVGQNDLDMKQEIKDQFGIVDAGYKAANQDIQSTISNIQSNMTQRIGELSSLTNAVTTANQEHMDLQNEHTKLRDERIMPMEAAVVKIQAEAIAFHTGLSQQVNNLETETKKLRMEVDHAKSMRESGGSYTSQDGGSGYMYKPIMEYKVMQDLKVLTNNKSGWRDWKIRMKDGMVSSFKTDAFLVILEWAEDANTQALTAQMDMNEVMQQAYNEYQIPQHEETWKRISGALKSLITQKSEDGSEPFLMTKRSVTGIAAWNKINKWYLATSGAGITTRMKALMQPTQAKNETDVIHEVEKWHDEYKECLALGASEMGWDYQLTAMRSIATTFIKEKMDAAAASSEGMIQTHKEKYDAQYAIMMNWAHIKMSELKDKGNKMDIGGLAGNEGWEDWERQLAIIKGKGKGGFGGKGFGGKGFKGGGKGFKGYGKGFKGFGKGFKGEGKGFKGTGKGNQNGGKGGKGSGPIFYANCNNCGERGHSMQYCPQLGKGFPFNCNACGRPGHKAVQCPNQPKGKGKGGLNMAEGEPGEEPETEGLHLGGSADEDKSKEEEATSKQESSQRQNWNQAEWNNWNQNGYGAYFMEVPYAQYRGEWEQYPYPGCCILYGKEEKVDAGEVVNTGFKVVTRKKFGNNRETYKAKTTMSNSQNQEQRDLMTLKQNDEMETVKVDAVMDSGAYDIVVPKEMIGGNRIRQTESSKAGYSWYDVKGGEVKNLGEGDLKGVSHDGIPLDFTAQVGEGVKRMLLSVKRACKSGNMIIFGANMKAIRELAKQDSIEDNVIIGTKTGVKSEIKEKNGMYVYPMTITRKKGNAMDIGIMEAMQQDIKDGKYTAESHIERQNDEESKGMVRDSNSGLWVPF